MSSWVDNVSKEYGFTEDGKTVVPLCYDGVFDKAVFSWFDNVFEEHGFTEDGKTVVPLCCDGSVFVVRK